MAGLTQLRTLELSHTGVTDAGLKELAGLTQLEYLGSAPILWKTTSTALVPLRQVAAFDELRHDEARVVVATAAIVRRSNNSGAGHFVCEGTDHLLGWKAELRISLVSNSTVPHLCGSLAVTICSRRL